jgi:hypothetical protein
MEEWTSLRDVAMHLESYLHSTASQQDSSTTEAGDPPSLELSLHIVDVRPDLEALGVDPAKREELAAVLEENLDKMASGLQGLFENAWRSVSGDADIQCATRRALHKLHADRFVQEAHERAQRLLQLVQLQQTSDFNTTGGEGAEWTDATRALMERVYQQHPKLEAHEKKLLAEVSGLSLRQISIWVRIPSISILAQLRVALEPLSIVAFVPQIAEAVPELI